MAITGARQVKNTAAAADWTLEITGFNPFLVHKLKLPVKEFEKRVRKGGAQTTPVQEPGPLKELNWSFEAWIPTDGPMRTFLWEWNDLCKTRDTSQCYKDVVATLIGPNDEPVVRWRIEDATLPKLEIEELESTPDNKKNLNFKCDLTCNDIKMEGA